MGLEIAPPSGTRYKNTPVGRGLRVRPETRLPQSSYQPVDDCVIVLLCKFVAIRDV